MAITVEKLAATALVIVMVAFSVVTVDGQCKLSLHNYNTSGAKHIIITSILHSFHAQK